MYGFHLVTYCCITDSPKAYWLAATAIFHSSWVLLENLGGAQPGESSASPGMTKVTWEYSLGRWAGVEGSGCLHLGVRPTGRDDWKAGLCLDS